MNNRTAKMIVDRDFVIAPIDKRIYPESVKLVVL